MGYVRDTGKLIALSKGYKNTHSNMTLVYEKTKQNGKKYQQIDIYYAGIGTISIPTN